MINRGLKNRGFKYLTLSPFRETFDKTLVFAVYDYDRFSSSDQQSKICCKECCDIVEINVKGTSDKHPRWTATLEHFSTAKSRKSSKIFLRAPLLGGWEEKGAEHAHRQSQVP